MLTRGTHATRVCEVKGKYTFDSKDSFPYRGMLPTNREVLQRLLHEENWRTKQAADVVAQQLQEHWLSCNVYNVYIQ